MRFIVCVKQVPSVTEIKIDPKTGTLIREGVPSILNHFDQYALEEALRIKSSEDEVIALSMGPLQAQSALLKCLALGADKAVLISDRAFAGSDTFATSYVLAQALKKLSHFDIIFCGQQAMDGDTAQVAPELAQNLLIPQVTYVERVESLDRAKNRVVVKSVTEEGYKLIEVKLPVVLAFLPPTSFVLADPKLSGIMKAKQKPLLIWSEKDLEVEKGKYGLDGSPTQVVKVYSPPARERGIVMSEEPKEASKKIVKLLLERKLIE
ncbi:MAG: electron transfer flavoprotein subunit beta/FixA family protein [Candidatus Thermoplasmatota archaeon]|nr:electron transfer flavoprotein subunit beta/FixA family protein [Candidatus Thermoplasmatota archaeon]